MGLLLEIYHTDLLYISQLTCDDEGFFVVVSKLA